MERRLNKRACRRYLLQGNQHPWLDHVRNVSVPFPLRMDVLVSQGWRYHAEPFHALLDQIHVQAPRNGVQGRIVSQGGESADRFEVVICHVVVEIVLAPRGPLQLDGPEVIRLDYDALVELDRGGDDVAYQFQRPAVGEGPREQVEGPQQVLASCLDLGGPV